MKENRRTVNAMLKGMGNTKQANMTTPNDNEENNTGRVFQILKSMTDKTDQPQSIGIKKKYWDKRGRLITHPALIAVAERKHGEYMLRWEEKNPELSKEIEEFEKKMERKYASKYKNTGSYGI